MRMSSRFGSRLVGRPSTVPGSLVDSGISVTPISLDQQYPLGHGRRPPIGTDCYGAAQADELPLGCARGDVAKDGPVERVHRGRSQSDSPEAEREDGVLGI